MMWAATPFASAASCGEVRNDWPTTETVRGGALLPDHLADDLAALLAAAGEHHRERVDEGKARPLDRKRRQRLRIEADHEVRNGVGRTLSSRARFGDGLRLAFRVLCERFSHQGQCPSCAEKQPAID